MSICNLFSLYLLYKSIFLSLLLCRVVTSKVLEYEAENLPAHTLGQEDYKINCNKMEFEKCTISLFLYFTDPVTFDTELYSTYIINVNSSEGNYSS